MEETRHLNNPFNTTDFVLVNPIINTDFVLLSLVIVTVFVLDIPSSSTDFVWLNTIISTDLLFGLVLDNNNLKGLLLVTLFLCYFY